MLKRAYGMLAGIAALSVFCSVNTASALTMKQCSEKYKTAAGSVGSMTWNDFRKAECGPDATMALKKAKATSKEAKAPATDAKQAKTVAPVPTAKEKSAATKSAAASKDDTVKVSEKECSARYQAAKSAGTLGGMTWNSFRSAGCPQTVAKRSGSMMPTAASMFPTTISRKYSGEKPGRARLLTCRDQYEANKAAGISEPKWTEEGGGYYSECNKRLSQQ